MIRTFTLLIAACVCFTLSAGAQDKPTDKPAADKPAAVDPALYTPPKANDAETISAWVEKVSQTPAPDRSQAGLKEHFGKLEKAADSIIARGGDVEDGGLIDAVRLKVGANNILEQLGDEEAAQRKSELIAKLKEDPRPTIAVHGRLLDVEAAVAQLQPDDDKAAQKIVDQVAKLLQEKPLTDAHVSVAYTVAESVEANADEKLATSAYNLFAKYLKAGGDPKHASVAEMFEGSARRINLVGNPIQIKGTTLEGKPFNIDVYKGKVVLVDFWATWCGPCIEELPNIKALYDEHHEAGFEVVGVNMDDNVGRVEAFVKTQKLAWPQLVGEEGKENPLANYYGVYQLPTTFLVGRDGKVSAVDLYGDDLTEEVTKLVDADK